MSFQSRDEARDPLRFHPLFDRTREQAMETLHKVGIPHNSLHDADMPSIGCQPYTRTILPGQDERAKRWRSERGGTREYGLHLGPDGKPVRGAGGKDGAA